MFGIPKALSMSITYEYGTDVGLQSQMCGISTYCEMNCHHPFAQNREGDCDKLLFVAQQCTPSYCCPYNDHPSSVELEHSQQPNLQFRLDDFRFSPGWTHKGGSKRLKIQGS
jgi:hypothetical protein